MGWPAAGGALESDNGLSKEPDCCLLCSWEGPGSLWPPNGCDKGPIPFDICDMNPGGGACGPGNPLPCGIGMLFIPGYIGPAL